MEPEGVRKEINMGDDTITAIKAAEILGISLRAAYELAAPKGPVPGYRYGKKCVRFQENDIREYKESCRFTTIKETNAGDLHLTKLSTKIESGSLSYFRSRGIAVKLKSSIKKKPHDCTEPPQEQ